MPSKKDAAGSSLIGRLVQPWLGENRCLLLLITLVGMLLLAPLFGSGRDSAVLGIFQTVVMMASIVAMSFKRRDAIIGLGLGIPFMIYIWIARGEPGDPLNKFGSFFAILFLGYTTIVVLRHVLQPGRVTRDRLFGAACVYLLIGLTWAFAYVLIESQHPGAFSVRHDDTLESTSVLRMMYFSYITLTTLGYGDIVPVHPIARAAVVLEAILGVLYVAVLVARLVGMYSAHEMRDISGGD